MAYQAASIDAISQAIRDAFKAAMPDSEPGIWPNNLYVVGKALAPVFRAAYRRLEWLAKQQFASTAADEALGLQGNDFGLTANPATLASGTATAVTDISTVIPAGTRLLRADDIVFVTLTDVTAAATTSTLQIAADEAGKSGNTLSGVALTLETPITGVGAITVDADGLAGGTDVENLASFRARVLDRKRNPAQGGAPVDYLAWARQLPGVTRAFVRRATPAAGYVTIVFMMDDTYSDGIPQAADVTALTSLLDGLAPANASILVFAPSPVPVNVTISNLVPNAAKVQDAVRLELLAAFRRRAEPGSAADPFTFSRSWISEAIANATGETSHDLVLPIADISCIETSDGAPEIATLGTLTFT